MKKKQIFIELTSLLDVILIMLFMVMVQAENKTEEAVEKAEKQEAAFEAISKDYEDLSKAFSDKETEMEQALAELEEAKEKLNSRDLVMENIDVLTVRIRPDRSIFLHSEYRSFPTIDYSWEEPDYAYNRLKASLRDWISRAEDRSLFLVFRYDAEEIYHNEYEMIRRAVSEIRTEFKKQDITFYYIETDMGSEG